MVIQIVNKICRKLALVFIPVFVNGHLSGQTLPDERVIIKTDREIYLCGERIYFGAYTFESDFYTPVTFSSILYAELYGQDNQVIARTKVVLKKGAGAGRMEIPRNVITGVYYLRAYTNYMKNFGLQQFYHSRLKLVNPFHNSVNYLNKIDDTRTGTEYPTLPKDHGDTLSPAGFSGDPVKTFNIKILPDKCTYNVREDVKVSVSATDWKRIPVKTGLMMLAVLTENDTVKDQSLTDRFRVASSSALRPKTDLVPISYLPEIYGDIISGKLIYDDGRPAGGIEVWQAFTGPAGCIESAKTDNNGRFYFLTDNEKNKGDLILRIRDMGNNILLIPDNEFFDSFPDPRKEPFSLGPDEAALVARQFINIQVEDAFTRSAPKKEIVSETRQVPFYGKEFTEYTFSDYAKLPNMKEFIFEVIVGVVALKENRKDMIVILDANGDNNLGSEPLMMIDGIPVADASAVLGLNPEKVKSVRVLRSRYFYKKQIFDGILDIITYDGDARSLSLSDNTFRYDFVHAREINHVEQPDFNRSAEGQIPVYKNLLYWNSCLETNAEGKAEVTFHAPDNSGKYIIECIGFTPDGMAGEGRHLIQVGKN